MDGGLVGAQPGCDHQIDQVMLGIEPDGSLAAGDAGSSMISTRAPKSWRACAPARAGASNSPGPF
jgi:hypothetical protein